MLRMRYLAMGLLLSKARHIGQILNLSLSGPGVLESGKQICKPIDTLRHDHDTVQTVHQNGPIHIPIGAVHRLENPGNILLELIEVQQTGSLSQRAGKMLRRRELSQRSYGQSEPDGCRTEH
jgi:hypothetical protein